MGCTDMPLAEGQVQVGFLVMGEGTPYRMLEFAPWTRTVRADQGGDRAWNHGSWSGAEWQDEAVVPMLIRVVGDDAGSWLALHQALAAAFAPSNEDVELRWVTGGVEFLLLGRPRLVDPRIRTLARGQIVTKAGFVALDPAVYSGALHTVQLALPIVTGGLAVPITVPFSVDATVLTGRAEITNAGTKPVGLKLRIDGPVVEPRVLLLTDGAVTTLQLWLTLTAGQWLDIDTGARTVHINGTVSRRGNASGGWPELPHGTHELFFDANAYDAAALLTASWRDAWH